MEPGVGGPTHIRSLLECLEILGWLLHNSATDILWRVGVSRIALRNWDMSRTSTPPLLRAG